MISINRLIQLLVLSIFLSCGSQDAVLEVNSFKEFQVPAGLSVIEAHYFSQRNIPVLFDNQVNAAGIPFDDISSFVPGRATLLPDNGRNFDMSFIRGVNIFLVDPVDSEKRYEIFYLDLVEPGEKTEIRLFNNITDLKDILQNDKAHIETRLEFYTPPPSTFEFRLNMTFSVFTSE